MRESLVHRIWYQHWLETRVWLQMGCIAAVLIAGMAYFMDRPDSNYSGYNTSFEELHRTGHLPAGLAEASAALPSLGPEADIVFGEAIYAASLVLWFCPLFGLLGPFSGGTGPCPYVVANMLALPVSRARLFATRFAAMSLSALGSGAAATVPTLARAAWGHHAVPWGPILLSLCVAWLARVPLLAGAEVLSLAAESRRTVGIVAGILAVPFFAVNIWLNFAVWDVLVNSKELLWLTVGSATVTASLLVAAVRIVPNKEF